MREHNYSRQITEDVFAKLENIMKTNGSFDHLVRAVEEYFIEEAKAEIVNIKKKAKDPNYQLSEHEKNWLELGKGSSDIILYKIHKVHSDSIGIGQASINYSKRGAVLYYNSNGSYLTKHLAIAHELAHALFHTIRDEEVGVRRKVTPNDSHQKMLMETQANYFAEIAMAQRAAQFRDKRFIDEHLATTKDVNAAIRNVYPDYDPSNLS